MTADAISQATAGPKHPAHQWMLLRIPAVDTLSVPAFRKLWSSNNLFQLGNHTRLMVFAWLTLELTDSQLWVGLVNGLPAIAIAFLSLWGGVLVDRSSPHLALLRSRFTIALGALVTAFLASAGMLQVWHLLALSFIMGGISGMDFVAYRVMLAETVGKERVLHASTLSSIAMNLANVVGPSIGGILLAQLGNTAALWAVAIPFCLAYLVIARMPKGKVQRSSDSSPLQDLVAGMRYTWHTPHVRWLIILGSAAVLAAAFFPLVPSHVRGTLHGGPESLGFLMGAFGAGGLVGAVILMTQKDVRRKGLALVLMSLIWCLGVLGLGVSQNIFFSAGCLFIIGISLSIWLTNLNTLLLTTVDTLMQGRVISLNRVLMQLPLAWLLGGLLAEILGYFGTLALGGGLFLALHVVAYWSTPKLREGTLQE